LAAWQILWGREAETMRLLRKFYNDASGATAIEYALIAVGLSVVILLAVNAMGGQLKTTFTTVKDELAKSGK
jgi:pilus assembly protein Flp/PilA